MTRRLDAQVGILLDLLSEEAGIALRIACGLLRIEAVIAESAVTELVDAGLVRRDINLINGMPVAILTARGKQAKKLLEMRRGPQPSKGRK